jgi:hypothetical protein
VAKTEGSAKRHSDRLALLPTHGKAECHSAAGCHPALHTSQQLLKSCWLPALLACLAFILHGEIIDRIAVSVGNQAITTSDLDREIRIEAFLNRSQPDFSPASRHTTADRLVEQRLIQRELDNSRYPPPAASEIDPILEKFKKDNFSSDEAYLHELASRGITDQQVREELLWQRRLLLFIDVRFRPAVQVSEQEIEDYFHKTVEPSAKAAHPGQPVTLEQYHDQIEEKLTGDQVDKDMTSWLASARQRSEVVVHPEAFQ